MHVNKHWSGWRWIERACLLAGVFCLVWVGSVSLRGALYEREVRTRVDAWPREAGDAHADRTERARVAAVAESAAYSGVIGVLEIPRLEYAEAVTQGDDDTTLRVSVGHLPDTPLPWGPGNSVLAGHRDTHFRALRNLVIGDRITFKTPRGMFEYEVKDKVIVEPDDLSVVAPTDNRTLTLITCYPFTYIGNAPQRFIVRAEAVGEASP